MHKRVDEASYTAYGSAEVQEESPRSDTSAEVRMGLTSCGMGFTWTSRQRLLQLYHIIDKALTLYYALYCVLCCYLCPHLSMIKTST